MNKIFTAFFIILLIANTVFSQQLPQNRIDSVIINTSNDSTIFAQNQFRLNEDIREHLFNINFTKTDTAKLTKNRVKDALNGCMAGFYSGVGIAAIISLIGSLKGEKDAGLGFAVGGFYLGCTGGIIGFLIGFFWQSLFNKGSIISLPLL